MLIECMEEGTTTEKMYAAKVIWQLAFDESLRAKLEEDDTLMNLLDTLSTDSDRLLSVAASGAKWVIEKQAEENKMLNIGTKGKHIMISYQWDNQKTMVEVKKRLQNAGLNVWMDVEKMAGSTLQAMAEAVENAYIIIMCISAKYKESPSCRTEAEYSFELRKDIIPLMMDKNYKPDGWLGAILGSKLYIDFGKHANFEDSFHRLKKELGNHVPSSGDVVDGPAVASTTKQGNGNANDSEVFSWTKEDVEKWLKENQLDFCLNLFTEYDGPLICQLQQLRREAPGFFFKSLRREMGFNSMTEILQFVNALEKLNI
ncbi:uncharacterized protein LOC120540543 [Polypterus senegalus]|uniref:uncharacterized protein LOC120540543 n=1 Tax=Polypterus senegalus TaxID=55291 RepID=UPI001965A7C0|nr:uncharacterized protein LOC120540543 [Polypterus senegalus]